VSPVDPAAVDVAAELRVRLDVPELTVFVFLGLDLLTMRDLLIVYDGEGGTSTRVGQRY